MPAFFLSFLYSLTLFTSAFLLFSVQPMFSKMILPLLGGAPQVWNTAMLFFQSALLAGYTYAHASSFFLKPRLQFSVHLLLLVLFALSLPFTIPADWQPPAGEDPTFWQLGLMTLTVGGPFFILAASAPILQKWFSLTPHHDAHNPYFLYSASNLGSMLGLLSYPFVIEPLFDLSEQSSLWTYLYAGLVALTILAGTTLRTMRTNITSGVNEPDSEHITWEKRLKWLVLAFIPSSLMLGVTTYVTTDIAAVPLLWVVPLALYVGTFVIAFARKQFISKDTLIKVHGFFMISLAGVLIFPTFPPLFLMGFHITAFFVTALLCHTFLVAARPKASHLTEFYLIMSLGGVLGGIFNSLIATKIFLVPIEYTLALALACFVPFHDKLRSLLKFQAYHLAVLLILVATVCSFFVEYRYVIGACAFITVISLAFLIDKRLFFALGMCCVFLVFPTGHPLKITLKGDVIHNDRSFFGVLKVVEDQTLGYRYLLHGRTNHGTQAIAEEHKLTKLSYYSPASPVSDAFNFLDRKGGLQNIAVVGLGVGVTACYTRDGRSFDFFEIDKKVVEIAENPALFSFLSDCGTPYDIILGDGRLTMAEQPDDYYDLIILDAFSSDNVPVHLLTLEAIEMYKDKLKDDGLLLFNISNKFVDLEPVLSLAARHFEWESLAKQSEGGKLANTDLSYYPAHFITMTPNLDAVVDLKLNGWDESITRKGVSLWTDQYSNLISVLDNKSSKNRFRKENKEEASE